MVVVMPGLICCCSVLFAAIHVSPSAIAGARSTLWCALLQRRHTPVRAFRSPLLVLLPIQTYAHVHTACMQCYACPTTSVAIVLHQHWGCFTRFRLPSPGLLQARLAMARFSSILWQMSSACELACKRLQCNRGSSCVAAASMQWQELRTCTHRSLRCTLQLSAGIYLSLSCCACSRTAETGAAAERMEGGMQASACLLCPLHSVPLPSCHCCSSCHSELCGVALLCRLCCCVRDAYMLSCNAVSAHT